MKLYLVGGSPRTGKTTLAKKLAQQLEISCVSTDDLESIALSTVLESEYPKLFPKKIMRIETHQSNDEMYDKYSAKAIVEAYLKQATSVYKTIKQEIGSISENSSLILEGYHVTPELVDELSTSYEIKVLFLGRESLENTSSSIKKGTEENNWVINKTKHEETFLKIAEMIQLFSFEIKEKAKERGFEYRNMDGDFSQKLKDNTNYYAPFSL